MRRQVERNAALIAAAGSALGLAAAFWFQYGAGLAPCPLCIWQRWPHGVAAAAGLALLALSDKGGTARALVALGGLAMVAGTGIAVFHAGVEQGWWAGPSACAVGDVSGLDPDALLEQILAAPIVRCDEIAWSFAGLSMAAWNGVMSAALALLWVRAALGRPARGAA